jgi:hypothetical protein
MTKRRVKNVVNEDLEHALHHSEELANEVKECQCSIGIEVLLDNSKFGTEVLGVVHSLETPEERSTLYKEAAEALTDQISELLHGKTIGAGILALHFAGIDLISGCDEVLEAVENATIN